MRDFIKQAALSVGFDACGIAKATALEEDAAFLKQWLAEGRHGEMHYLARNFEKRTDPREMVPGCKSVVVVLLNYSPADKQNPTAPQIAKYAYSETDYHQVIKAKLTELEGKITEAYGPEVVCKNHQHTFVDSAPVLERRWAERAGLGWIGKHTQLIHPGLGSYCFIGVLMLNVETEYDVPIRPACGSCTRCMDACPTGAIHNGTIDARKCISYLTIENKDEIPAEFQPQLSGCALGCDICADVCPWNKKWAIPHKHWELSPVAEMLEWDREAWLQLSETEFNHVFKKSAVKRAGYNKLKQNIKLAIDSRKD
ncbi:MAG: tRNA epoxyqueuosine(34) reductase QueG [Paludibacter sp.]